MSKKYLPVRGPRSFQVKDKLRNMGGYWKAEEKCWYVPETKHAEALRLVGGRPAAAPGTSAFDSFVPTPEQAALRDFVMGGEKNLFCEAGAGAGKTTTSLWLVHLLAQRACVAGMTLRIAFVAFNSDVASDIREKAPEGIEVLTMNALGFRALKRAWNVTEVDVSPLHLFTVFKARFGVEIVKTRSEFFGKVNKLIGLAKGALVDNAEDMDILATTYELDLNGETAEAIKVALEIMNAQKADKTTRATMSFDDQMWLAVVHNVSMPQYDVLVIDEEQDTNALQLEMLSRCVAPGGRVIGVGDRRQAIYGFRGADGAAVDNFIERFDATVLPLMTSFRCAKAVVREAQKIVPQFKAGENNAEGEVRSIDSGKLLSQIKPGDFVISRTNAPLVAFCIKALAAGIPAAIVGKDLDRTLLAAVDKIMKKSSGPSIEQFCYAAEMYVHAETERLSRKVPVPEAAITAIRDRVDCLLAFADDCSNVNDIKDHIRKLVSNTDDERRVDFTTAHKAKGRERNRVFLFEDTFCCPRKDKKTGAWIPPSEEEWNLAYVATTRAKLELVYVKNTKRVSKREE